MQRALDLAAMAKGRTNPNPMVGAVIVKNGQIVGEGYHRQAGTPHAEVHALNEAGGQARGATLYVSLEPCSHFGRTPPCADAVIEAGIKRTVVAALDPNPLVAGQGINKLRAAGVEIKIGLLKKEATRLNEVFFKYIQTRLPFVALKTAMTLDGKIASFSGDSRWVTGPIARNYVHQLRNTYDAILVGIGTVLKDDPQLNTRLETETKRDPIRIVIDTELELPMESKIARSAVQQRTIVFCASQAEQRRREKLQTMGLEIISLDCTSGLLPLQKVLEVLGEIGLCSLLVEGGGEINGYLIENNLVDKVYWFIAPKIIGGRLAPTPIGGRGIALMNEALPLGEVEIGYMGQDLLITGYFKEWC